MPDEDEDIQDGRSIDQELSQDEIEDAEEIGERLGIADIGDIARRSIKDLRDIRDHSASSDDFVRRIRRQLQRIYDDLYDSPQS